MADFCLQCTALYFGEEYALNNDMKGIVANSTLMARVLCEGCSGYIWVDMDGKCLDHYVCELADSAYSMAGVY